MIVRSEIIAMFTFVWWVWKCRLVVYVMFRRTSLYSGSSWFLQFTIIGEQDCFLNSRFWWKGDGEEDKLKKKIDYDGANTKDEEQKKK